MSKDSKIKVSGNVFETTGNVNIGHTTVINYNTFSNYRELRTEIERLEQTITALSQIPNNEELVATWKQNLLEKRQAEKSLRDQIKQTAEYINSLTPSNSELLEKAKELFIKGDFKGANEILEEEVLSEKRKKFRVGLKEIADSYLLKAQAIALNMNDSERVNNAAKYYKESVSSYSFYENNFLFARFLHQNHRLQTAKEYYLKALEIQDISALQKIKALRYLGQLFQDLDTFQESIDSYQSACDLAITHLDENPVRFRMELLACYNDIGTIFKSKEKFNEALGFYERGVEELSLVEQTIKPGEFRLEFLKLKAAILNNKGLIFFSNMETAAAKNYLEAALRVYTEIQDKSPTDPEYLADLATLQMNLGALYYQEEDSSFSLKYYQDALSTYKALDEKSPYAHDLEIGSVHLNLGLYFIYLDPNRDKSIKHEREGMKLLTPFLDEMPEIRKSSQLMSHHISNYWNS